MGTRASNKHNKSMKSVVGGMLYGTVLSAESIKVVAEAVGVVGISDDAAKELAEDISHRVKAVVQDAKKCMTHSKRSRMLTDDIDRSLQLRGVEAQYGFVSKDFIPFRFASGGGRELHFMDEKEIDLTEIIQNFAPKLPIDISLRAHWLVVDGIQPTIPENPPPLSRDMQILESVDPVSKLNQIPTIDMCSKPQTGKLHKLRNMETVHVKQLATHELSVEQQLYYKEITEACVGSDEPRRGEALQSLAADPGLHEMVPRLCTFISEGVKVNVVQKNLALLIYLMRMVKALLDNSSLYLEKYLHELVPSVTTCIVSKQLCMRPELDNHWALRDFASRLMAQICKNFNTTTNCLQTRITRIFSKALQTDKTHLSTLYGSIAGLSELGGEVVKVFIIARLKFISDRIECHLVGASQSNTDKTAAGHIRAMVQKICPPILKQIRCAPDYVEEYKNDFGFLGPSLCQAVAKLRISPQVPSLTPATINAPITSAAQTATTCRQLPASKTILSTGAITTQHQSNVQQASPQSPPVHIISNQNQVMQTSTQQYQNDMEQDQMQSIGYYGMTPPVTILSNCMSFNDIPPASSNVNVNNVGSTVTIDSNDGNNGSNKAICQMDVDMEEQEADLSSLQTITPMEAQTIIIDSEEMQRSSQELVELPQFI